MKQIYNTDVMIVGGGPAGTTAALTIRGNSQLKVLLIENTALNLEKIGEHVHSKFLDYLDYLNIDRLLVDFIPSYNSLAAWGSSEVRSRYSGFSPIESTYQINRQSFDHLLLQEACNRGVIILPRTKCTQIQQADDDHWEAKLHHFTKGEISVNAKYVIDATGRQCSITKKLTGGAIRQDDLIGVGAFLVVEQKPSLQNETFIESDESGWWYSANLPNGLTTATFFTDKDILKKKELSKPEYWIRQLAKTVHLKSKLKNATTQDRLWVRHANSQINNPGTLRNFIAVGDAAAAFDPISSMGIGFALSSGSNGGLAIIQNERGDLQAFFNYRQAVEVNYRNYLKIKKSFYDTEKRWSNSEFWQRRQTH